MVKLTYQLIMMMNEVLIHIQAGAICTFFARFDGSQITFNRTGHPLNQLPRHMSRWQKPFFMHMYWNMFSIIFGNCFYCLKESFFQGHLALGTIKVVLGILYSFAGSETPTLDVEKWVVFFFYYYYEFFLLVKSQF